MAAGQMPPRSAADERRPPTMLSCECLCEQLQQRYRNRRLLAWPLGFEGRRSPGPISTMRHNSPRGSPRLAAHSTHQRAICAGRPHLVRKVTAMLAATFVCLSLGLVQLHGAPANFGDPSAPIREAAEIVTAGAPDNTYQLVQYRDGGGRRGRGDHRGNRHRRDRRDSLDADNYLYDFRDTPRWRAEERRDRHHGRSRERRHDWDRGHGRDHDRGRHHDRDDRHRDNDRDKRDRGHHDRDDRNQGDWDYGRGFDNDRSRNDRPGDDRLRERRERFEERRKRW